MANRNQILPTGSEQPEQISPQLQEVIEQTRAGEPVALTPPSVITEEIRKKRELLETAGQLPADISTDQVDDGMTAGGLKLQGIAAKYFPDLAIEKLGVQDYFPGYRPTQEIGSVSGRIIGKQPIFVGSGGLFPFGIIDARKRALEKAAQIKLAAQSAFLEGGPEGPAQYQRDLDDSWYDFVNRTGQKVGWDLTRVKGDPEVMREASIYYAVAKELTFLTENAKGVLDDAMTKENFVPKENMDFASLVWSGELKVEEILKNPGKFMEDSKKLQSFSNLINVLRTEYMPMFKEQISELVSDIPNEAAMILMRENDYNLIRKTLKDYVDPELMDGWASLIKENSNLFQKQSEIKDALEKVIGNQVKQDLFSVRKFNLASMSARKKVPTAISQQPGFFNVKDVKEVEVTEMVEGKEVTTTELKEEIVPIEFIGGWYNIAGIKMEPAKINIIPDILYNTVDDRIERTLGTMNADVVAIGPLAVNEKGAIVFGPGGVPPKDLLRYTIKDFAVVRANQDMKTTYTDRKGEKKTGKIKKGSTRLILSEKVEQPLKNAGITKEKGQFLFEGEPIGEGGLTINILEGM